MQKLSELKKSMLEYASTVVDLEEDETPEDWVECMIECLRDDGLIHIVDDVEYVDDNKFEKIDWRYQ